MDKKIAQNMIVGVFVIAGFFAFTFIIFNIGGGKGFFSSEYTLFAKFKHVKGLNYGSEVSLSGLRAGTVKKISVSSAETKELIAEFTVSKDLFDKVRKDTVATIRTSGVLGDKYIELSIGNPTEPEMKNGDFIPSEEPEDIFSKGGDLVENISRNFQKGSDFESLLKNLNKVAFNLSIISGEMTKEKGLFYEVIHGDSGKRLSATLGNLEQISKKINSGEGSLGALINDPTVYEDLKSMMGGAKRSAILRYFMNSFIESGSEKATPPKK